MGWITITIKTIEKMKLSYIFKTLFSLVILMTSCETEEFRGTQEDAGQSETPDESANIPDGYFVATFTSDPVTRAAVSGSDGRVKHLRYLVYKSTGEFVKEKIIVQLADPIPSWPLAAIRDTLPQGSYNAFFLGNTEKTQFPYPTTGGTAYSDVLLNYKGHLADARIALPNGQITDNNEYYWAKVAFSDAAPTSSVLLQRAIGMFNVHRNFVDAQLALNSLVNNIVTQIGYRNTIRTTVQGLLPGTIGTALSGIPLLIVTDELVNALVGGLVEPITDALYNILLSRLVDQIGMALTGNTNQNGTLAFLGVLLNPWAQNEAKTAIVTIRNFPKAMDLNLNVVEYYINDHTFRYDFNGASVYDEKDILIRGLNGPYDVRNINVIKTGLISGIVVDQVIDNSLLLNGAFIDVTDQITAPTTSNRRYKADYSFLDLYLKSYTQQTDGPHSLTLSVKIGNVANIDNILGGLPLLPGILGLLLTPVKNITINVPVNLPLLGVDNLQVSGSWSSPAPY